MTIISPNSLLPYSRRLIPFGWILESRRINRRHIQSKKHKNKHSVDVRLLSQPDQIQAHDIAVVIAAINEEIGIAKTLKSLLKITSPRHIYLTNDGSKDNTETIARKYQINIITNPSNIGKTKSLKKSIVDNNLLNKYKAIMFMDADTSIDEHFYKYALPVLNKPEVAAIAGRVKTIYTSNMFVAFRALSYAVWQQIWKQLCNYINGVVINPGTAAIYKSSVFKNLEMDADLIIEDYDLTFQLHRLQQGRLVYVPKSIVYTQDPNNLHDYHRQLIRWNLGMFQAALKHRVPTKLQSFELVVSYFLIQSILHAVLLLILPLYLIYLTILGISTLIGFQIPDITYLEVYITRFILMDVLLLVLVSGLYFTKHRYWSGFKYTLAFWLVQYVNISAFIIAILRLFKKNRTSVWVTPTRWRSDS